MLWKNVFKNIAFVAMALFFISGIVLSVKAYNFVNRGELQDLIEESITCDIEFKDLKYSGPCDSQVINAVEQYGEGEFILESLKLCKGDIECMKELDLN